MSIGQVIYAAATILPGTQQIVGLGKMGYGIYKLCSTPKIETEGVSKLFAKPNQKGIARIHLKEGAALFIPIIGTIFAIYKLIISCKSTKNNKPNNEIKQPEKEPTPDVKKETPKKTIKQEQLLTQEVIPLQDQPLTTENLSEKFAELTRKCVRNKNKNKLSAAFALEIKNANLIEQFKNMATDNSSLAKTLKKRIIEVDLPKLNKK